VVAHDECNCQQYHSQHELLDGLIMSCAAALIRLMNVYASDCLDQLKLMSSLNVIVCHVLLLCCLC
jgi:hypothetical protein